MLRRRRDVLTVCVSLLPVALVCVLTTAVLVVLRADRRRSGMHGKLYTMDAGPELCLQQPATRGASQLVLAPCQLSTIRDSQQTFRLDVGSSQLMTSHDRCVDDQLRVSTCVGEDQQWVFTQGSGMVHVATGLCLTRGATTEVSLRRCENRPDQYWWFQFDDSGQPESQSR